MLRSWFVKLHRWFGLGAAAFLFVAGLTGALIAWDHELDAWLNPGFYQARSEGPAQPALALAARVESAEPGARIRYMPLATEPGQALLVSLEPRLDPATGRPYELGYNQVAVDPATGTIQARREWGRASLSRENLLPFLYKLHYSLHLPKAWGLELGILLMGVLAIFWVFDCFIALWISFPSLASWRQSFAFRWRQGGPRLVFDLHRSGGVWAWLLLLILAITSVSMNLNTQVMRPLVSRFSPLTPSPFERRAGQPVPPGEPRVSLADAVALAQAEARRRGWTAPPGGAFLSAETGLWGVGFFTAGRSHGDGGLGNPWLYVDAHTGETVGADVPGTGTAGDIFLQAMFPLHSGRILGLPGRLLVTCAGLAVATLSATGILIWLRRRRATRRVLRRPT